MQLKTFIECSGWLGTVLILGAYGLLTTARVQPRSMLYQWMNVVGAAGLIINGSWHYAWPSACLNIVWLAIAIYGITRGRARRPV